MRLYQEILDKSKSVDSEFENISDFDLNNVKIVFPVPKFHPRSKEISKYVYSSVSLEDLPKTEIYNLTKNQVFIIDNSVSQLEFVRKFTEENEIKSIILKSIENEVKTKSFVDNLIQQHSLDKTKDVTLVVIGGGLLLNVAAYIAERISTNFVQLPSTVLSMADSPGGKVRVNFLNENRAYKHFYKSFYEPNVMFLEDRFLDSLPEKQIKIGLVEIIKHGLFQSPKLYDFLLNSGRELFKDKQKLKKAILWAVNLKKVCLDIDVEENENGSRKILRGGHDFSDRIEEDERLSIPHGIAVAIGIIKQLEMEQEKQLLDKAKKIFDLFDIPYSVESFNNWN